ncbi:RNA-binding protein [Candidatus Woesearchaeota archaeon]|nr:RNA-binding protein [Candidatus Woesearchaeota archaeon]
MGTILVKEKSVVVPGEELAEGMDYLPAQGTYRQGDFIRAAKLGLVNVDGKVIKLIPLSGRYLPKKGDTIIGQVIDISFSGWRLDINSAYSAMLSLKDATSEFIIRGADLTQYYNLGDYLVAKITNVTSQKLVDLSMKGPGLRSVRGGRIVKVNTNKVPRVIGKQGSMVVTVKNATDTKIIVGQNGLVWVMGENPKMEALAVNTIKKIEAEAHMPGLTERIKNYLEEEVRKLKGESQ